MPRQQIFNASNSVHSDHARPIDMRRVPMRVGALIGVLAIIAVATAFRFDSTSAPTAAAQTDTSTEPELAEPVGPELDELTLRAVGEFIAPVELFARVGDERSFVVELYGTISVADPAPTEGGPTERKAADEESVEPILDISELTAVEGERGLLGAAFHPFEPLLYVHYSDLDGESIIAEYEIDPETAIADPETARQVLVVEQPYDNHNGGEIAFGRDGYLYLGFGDGGLANDPHRSALDLNSRLGKILRIDPPRVMTLRSPSRKAIRSPILIVTMSTRLSGHMACATHGSSRLTQSPATSGLPTLAKTSGKKSIGPTPTTTDATPVEA